MKNSAKFLAILIASLFLFFSCKKDENTSCEEQVDMLGINQLQVLGSHNSYRQATNPSILQVFYSNQDSLPDGFNPDDWDYSHLPLEAQFDQYGIRSIELDVYNDPSGGLFYYRIGNAVVGESPESGLPALVEP